VARARVGVVRCGAAVVAVVEGRRRNVAVPQAGCRVSRGVWPGAGQLWVRKIGQAISVSHSSEFVVSVMPRR
jgi:hypothetical protein